MNWKGYVLEGLVHWGLPCGAALLLMLGLRGGWPKRLPARVWDRWAVPAWCLSRLAYGALLYLVLGHQSGWDYQFWYHEHALPVLDGALPGRDFPSKYAPLFHYLNALGVLVTPGRHAVGVLLPFLAADAACVFVGRRLGEAVGGPATGRWIGAWLLATPLLWHELLVHGQDEALFLGLLVIAAFLLVRGHGVAGMLTLGMGICTTKVSFVPYAGAMVLAFWRPARRETLAVGALVLVVVVVYGAYVAVGGEPIGAFRDDSWNMWRIVGVGIPALAREFMPTTSSARFAIYGLGTAGFTAWVAWRLRGRPLTERIVATMATVHSASMLLMPFRLDTYDTQGVAFTLLFLGARQTRIDARAALWLLPVVAALVAVTTKHTLGLLQAAPPVFVLTHLLVVSALVAAARAGGTPRTGGSDQVRDEA